MVISIHFRISIHAPRGGSDPPKYFDKLFKLEFQSTLPAGGATADGCLYRALHEISIHAPRGGSDRILRKR